MKNDYIIKGEYAFVILKNRKKEKYYTKVDKSSLGLLLKLNINWNPVKWPNSENIYVQGSLKIKDKKYKTIIMHRFLLNAEKGDKVDHINHDTLDNTIENLRIANSILNGQNRKSHQIDSKSKVRGVSWSKKNKRWIAQATIKKHKIYLGSYKDIDIANKVASDFRSKFMFLPDIDVDDAKEYADQLKKGYKLGKSGKRYVSYHKATSKWQARVYDNGKRIHLGLYETKEDAEQAVKNH